MANRYLTIFTLPSRLYARTSPIIIEAGALHKDTSLGDTVAQLKFRSVVPEKVASVTVDITCYDAAKEKLSSLVYKYEDVVIAPTDCFFGQKTLITLPNNEVRSFDVRITNVTFTDGGTIAVDSTEWQTIPRQTELSVHGDTLVNYFKKKFGNKSCAEPSVYEDLWLCTCKQENKAYCSTCSNCRASRDDLLPFDLEAENKNAIYDMALNQIETKSFSEAIVLLKKIPGWKDADEQIVACQKRIEEIKSQAELERQEEEKRVAKNRKIAIITAPIVCAVIAFIIVLNTVIIPNGKYNSAIALMNEENYSEAITTFEALGEYKDSVDKIAECKSLATLKGEYDKAVALLEAKKYDEAVTAFEALNGYKDSADIITSILDTIYNDAIAFMNEGKYSQAIAIFEFANGYKDSANKIAECNTAIFDPIYNDAIALMDAGNIVDAYEALVALDGYKDSTDKANSIYDKYKVEKLKVAKVGDYVSFGAYEQDNNTLNGKEDVEWLVLEVKDGKALVISKYALDCKPYNTSDTDVTWETCTLRKWLNDDFINAAFSANEKAMIPTVTVSADKNPKRSTNPGKATQDKVFLPSITEANKYFSSDSARQCKPTDYAVAKGAWESSAGICWWFLRSPGVSQLYAAGINAVGKVNEDGNDVDRDSAAVRPALWISLE